MRRRSLLLLSAVMIAGCGGSEPEKPVAPPPPPPPAQPVEPPVDDDGYLPPDTWTVTVPTLKPGQSVTIPPPPNAPANGTFSISEIGTPLPDFIRLSPTGVLTVSSGPVIPTNETITINGVIFAYQPPQ